MVTVISFQIDRQQCSVPIIGNENQVSISIADPTAGDIPRDLKINIYLPYIVFGSTRKYKEDTKKQQMCSPFHYYQESRLNQTFCFVLSSLPLSYFASLVANNEYDQADPLRERHIPLIYSFPFLTNIM